MDEILPFILYILIGTSSGLLAGLLGISGGVITVPCLFFIFRMLDFPGDVMMQTAIGTSLAAMCFNALSSTWAHARRQMVRWEVFFKMLLGIIFGSLLGAFAADVFSSVFLEMFFGLFAALLGLHFLHPYLPQLHKAKPAGSALLNLYGLGIAFLSNILGIGGGIITVPTLIHHKIPEKQAIATSAATGFVITLLGAIFYLQLGPSHTPVPHSVGYLYLPAFIAVGLSSFVMAPFGAVLTERASPALLRRIFGGVLFLTGISMLIF